MADYFSMHALFKTLSAYGKIKQESIHRVQTHALLLFFGQMCINIGIIAIGVKNALIDPVTLTFDLSTQNHVVSRISHGHSLYQV